MLKISINSYNSNTIFKDNVDKVFDVQYACLKFLIKYLHTN